jgi:hypothetical protein
MKKTKMRDKKEKGNMITETVALTDVGMAGYNRTIHPYQINNIPRDYCRNSL